MNSEETIAQLMPENATTTEALALTKQLLDAAADAGLRLLPTDPTCKEYEFVFVGDLVVAELLKMLQAGTVQTALEQLQAHFDKDKRLIDNFLDIERQREAAVANLKQVTVERDRWEALAQERGKIISDIAEKAVGRHRKWSLQQLNVESYAELIDDAACREFARGLIERAESASLKLAAADRLAEAVKLLTSMKFPIGGGDCPHGEESWYCVCCRSEWDDELAKAKTALRSALLEYSRTKV